MVIKTVKGTYKIIKNYREAFNETAFIEKYIEECMDKYPFIVGDISSGILRLKGFDTNPKSKNYFGLINDYLESSCAIGCPYYILKRIQSDNEYQKELSKPSEPKTEGFTVNSLVKESLSLPLYKDNKLAGDCQDSLGAKYFAKGAELILQPFITLPQCG